MVDLSLELEQKYEKYKIFHTYEKYKNQFEHPYCSGSMNFLPRTMAKYIQMHDCSLWIALQCEYQWAQYLFESNLL